MPRRRGPGPGARGGAGRPVARGRRTGRRRRRRRVMLVGGLVAFGTYKMTTKDAARIEEHTGVDPEELEDAELEQAMRELNIDQQTVTAADTEQGEPTPEAAPPSAASETPSYVEELTQLASLRDAGILTNEEFEAKKSQILGLN